MKTRENFTGFFMAGENFFTEISRRRWWWAPVGRFGLASVVLQMGVCRVCKGVGFVWKCRSDFLFSELARDAGLNQHASVAVAIKRL